MIDAAIDLLGADDAEFAARNLHVATGSDRAMLEELADEFDTTRRLFAAVVDALDMAASRLRDALAGETRP